ncbi:MAG: hypothetical protein RKO66_01225 [Candidatus Contendobacter sp.]|nr:hypothetical protein [Candidatus Contendobacter sp.]MDS4058392.1 hypothetical protein [Candidatus Contendobacter sp.]
MQANSSETASDEETARWFRTAANQGNARAQTSLGWMYAKDRGAEQSDREAVSWYRKAVEQGDADAKAALKRLKRK